MEHNNLSNQVMPKILVVWENVIGALPAGLEKKAGKSMERGQWAKAAGYWELGELALAKLIDLTMRQGLNVEAVSFTEPEDMAAEFEELLSDAGVPVAVWHSSPGWLARKIAVMPDVAVIFDPDPAHALTYGKKGRVLTDINQIGL